MLWPVILILKPLGSVGRIWLNGLGIRPAILLSLEEAKSLPVVLIWSRISSLVHSVWFSSRSVLYRDRAIVTRLSFLTHTPWLRRRVRRLWIVIRLQALKTASVKSVKSFLYCSHRLSFRSL